MANISTKELSYINDFLSWELLSAKKCYQYAHQETNPLRQQIFFEASNTHQQNYTKLLTYIQHISQTQGGQMS